LSDKGFRILTMLAAWFGVLVLVLLTWEVASGAMPAIEKFGWNFFTNDRWNPPRENFGAAPMIYGTLVTAFIALLIATPLGVGVGIFLTEDYLHPHVRNVIKFMVEMLAAIPSVIYGLWGLFTVVPITKEVGMYLYNNFRGIPLFSTPPSGPGILPASVVLAIMVLPTIAALSRVSLANVPSLLKSGALALGATRWEVIFKVTLPTAWIGIVGAVVLALGRALGETMALAMLVGNNNQISPSILAPGSTIAAALANNFGDATGMQVAALMYLSLILLGITLLVNIIAELILGKAVDVSAR